MNILNRIKKETTKKDGNNKFTFNKESMGKGKLY